MDAIDGPLYTPRAAVELFREKGVEISERTLRRKARELGAYREIGRGLFFLPGDLERIMAPKRPKPLPPRKSPLVCGRAT